MVDISNRAKKRRKPCKWEKTSNTGANRNEWRCIVCGQYGYGVINKAPTNCVRGLDSGPFKHFDPSLRDSLVDRSDIHRGQNSQDSQTPSDSPSHIGKPEDAEKDTFDFLNKHFVVFYFVVFFAVLFALIVSRFIFRGE